MTADRPASGIDESAGPRDVDAPRRIRFAETISVDLTGPEFGAQEVSPPLLVRDDAMIGTAQLPKFADDLFKTSESGGQGQFSSVGDTVTYNTLDNNKRPTDGIKSQLTQDLAGLGGDVNFLRTTEDLRYYHAINDDVVSLVRAQGGYISGWGGVRIEDDVVLDPTGPRILTSFPRDLMEIA